MEKNIQKITDIYATAMDYSSDALIVKAFVESEYEKYIIVQDRLFESDFDRLLKETEKDSEK